MEFLLTVERELSERGQSAPSPKRSLAGQTDEYKQTALHLAAERGHAGIAGALLASGARVNACDENYVTPLHAAAEGVRGDPRVTLV